MLINIKDIRKKPKFYCLTIDTKIKQIRVLFSEMGIIDFIDISRDDSDAFEYLYNNDKMLLLKCLKDYVGLKLNLKDVQFDTMENWSVR